MRLNKDRKNGKRMRKRIIFNVSIFDPSIQRALPLAFPAPKKGGHGLLGDFPFFFRPHGQDLDQTPVALDFQDFVTGLLVFLVVHRDPKPFETLAALFPDWGGIFADAAGEDHGIHPA
jgi:hypothetical protein